MRALWRAGGLVATMRPHQWVKNVFVLAPVVFAQEAFNARFAAKAVGAFGVFCLLASAVYALNDIVDRESDRIHPVKRFRPIACGRVPLVWARALAAALVVISLVGASLGPLAFWATAGTYFAQNVAYSLRLKRVAYLDVLIIASGFVLRVLAGGFATRTPISGYLLVCTALLALYLGFGKRRHEIALASGGKQRAALKGYSARGLDRSLALTGLLTLAGYVAYTLDPRTVAQFRSPRLWWTSVFVLLGIVRFNWLVRARPGAESPTQEMLRDGPFVAIVFSWVGAVMWIVYGLSPGH